MDLNTDLLTIICDYLDDTPHLNKDQYTETIKRECSSEWKLEYDNYLKELNLSFLILTGKYN